MIQVSLGSQLQLSLGSQMVLPLTPLDTTMLLLTSLLVMGTDHSGLKEDTKLVTSLLQAICLNWHQIHFYGNENRSNWRRKNTPGWGRKKNCLNLIKIHQTGVKKVLQAICLKFKPIIKIPQVILVTPGWGKKRYCRQYATTQHCVGWALIFCVGERLFVG